MSLIKTVIFLLALLASATASAGSCVLDVHRLQHFPKLRIAPQKTSSTEASLRQAGVSETTIGKLRHIQAITTNPNIVMGAMEFGNLKLAEQLFKISVGGEAVVVNDFMNLLPQYLRENFKSSKLALVIPAFGGLDLSKGRVAHTFSFPMGGHREEVKIIEFDFKIKHADGSESVSQVAFVQNHSFERYHHTKVYEADSAAWPLPGAQDAPTDFYNQAYTVGLFNKAINEYFWQRGANIYIAHDYQTVLAAKYMGKDPSAITIIHNGGYHGDLWAHGYGGAFSPRDYSYRAQGVPTGDPKGMDKIRDLLGFSWEEYLDLVEHDGSFNMLKLTRTWIEPHNGITKTVSQGYQEELSLSREEIYQLIRQQKGSEPLNPSDVYVFNNDIELGPIKGTDNGLSMENHAAQNPLLRAKDSVKDPFVAHRIEKLRATYPQDAKMIEEMFTQGIRFGENLDKASGRAQLKEAKAKMKRALQLTMGLEPDPKRPLITVFSRIVDQKNLGPFVENINRIIDEGGQVVIGGPIGDNAGGAIINRMKQIIDQLPPEKRKHVALISGDQYNESGDMIIRDGRVMDELKVMMMTGGDYFFITSKFEPCGLTDIESAWMGSMIIARQTGGLGKIESGLYYKWWDSSDYGGEIEEAWKTVKDAIHLYKNHPEEYLDRVIAGMTQRFDWNERFDILMGEIQFTGLKKLMNSLDDEIQQGSTASPVAKRALEEVLETFDLKILDEFFHVSMIREQYFAKQGYSLGIMERHFIYWYRQQFLPQALMGSEAFAKQGAKVEKDAVTFSLYVPNVYNVEVLTDRNNWKPVSMAEVRPGHFEITLPKHQAGDKYHFRVTHQNGDQHNRIDPFAKYVRQGDIGEHPLDADGKPWYAVIEESKAYDWKVKNFTPKANEDILQVFPSTLIEGEAWPNWREVAQYIVKHYKQTHDSILLEQVFHHNLHQSMGFLPGAIFSSNYRFGTPEDLKWAIDHLHQNGFSVKLDFPFHPSRDWDTGVAGLSGGDELYLSDAYHPHWGSRYYDYSLPQTRSYLSSWVRYWIEEYNIDGMRVDALASIMRKNYGHGDWTNHAVYDGEAIEFFQELRQEIDQVKKGFQLIAEDSHYTPGRHRPVQAGGLGFDQKYEMGGMRNMRVELNKNPGDRNIYRFYDSLVSFYQDDPDRRYMHLMHYLNNHDEAAFRGYDSEYPGVYFIEGIRDFGDDGARVAFSRILNAHIRLSIPGPSSSMVGDEFANVGITQGDQVVGRSWALDNAPNFSLRMDEKREKHLAAIKAMKKLKDSHPALQTVKLETAKMIKGDMDNQVGVVARFTEDGDHAQTVVTIMNLSNRRLDDYHIPVPHQKNWQIILNTDEARFGGWGDDIQVRYNDSGELILSHLPPLSYIVIK